MKVKLPFDGTDSRTAAQWQYDCDTPRIDCKNDDCDINNISVQR